MSARRWLTEGGILLCLLLMIILSLRGKTLREISPGEVRDALADELSAFPDTPDILLRQNFGMDPEDTEGVVYYASSDYMDVREVLILKSSDEELLSAAEEKFLSRVEEEKAIFESYGPQQYKELCDARVFRRGPWLVAVIADDSDLLAGKIRGMIER